MGKYMVFFFIFFLQKEARKPIIRSMSVPSNVKGGSLHRMNSLGGRFRVVQASPSPAAVHASPADDSTKTAGACPSNVFFL